MSWLPQHQLPGFPCLSIVLSPALWFLQSAIGASPNRAWGQNGLMQCSKRRLVWRERSADYDNCRNARARSAKHRGQIFNARTTQIQPKKLFLAPDAVVLKQSLGTDPFKMVAKTVLGNPVESRWLFAVRGLLAGRRIRQDELRK
jgi:hypothetical protein